MSRLPAGHISGVRAMSTIRDLSELTELVEKSGADLYVRWSRGPAVDLAKEGSRDELTHVRMPGLSANPLAIEPWWADRSPSLWVARRLYDYCHLREARGSDVRPWVLTGHVVGRGPDNEPLVRCREPIAWIAESVLRKAQDLVDAEGVRDWGPLDRRNSR